MMMNVMKVKSGMSVLDFSFQDVPENLHERILQDIVLQHAVE